MKLSLSYLTPHLSIPNVSNQVRWSVDARYQDAAKPTGYQPEAGFLARSKLKPDDVVTTPEDFKQIRDQHQPGPGPNRWAKTIKMIYKSPAISLSKMDNNMHRRNLCNPP